MKKYLSTKILPLILSLSLSFSLPCLPSVQTTAAATTTATSSFLETNVTTASSGCTLVGLYGSYYSQAQSALDKINDIRKEACEAGNVPDPRNPSRMLTPDDYRPLKWSSSLEKIARIRAAEACIAYAFMDSGHNRLNNKGTFSISFDGVSSSCEDIAYYYSKKMTEGVLSWYMEKQYWLSPSSEQETRHYTSMINPNYSYVGLGDFYCEAGRYPNTMTGEFSARDGLDETMLPAPENVMQKIEVADEYIQSRFLAGDTTLDTEKSQTLTPKIQLKRNKALREVWALDSLTYTSSDPSIASVTEDGTVTAHRKGTVSITAMAGDSLFASMDLTVECTHERTLVSHTPATCTNTGSKKYYCSICDDTTEIILPKTAHNYVYQDPDDTGKAIGVCADCHATITIIPPSNLKVTWSSSQFEYRRYTTELPLQISVGSTLHCWPQITAKDTNYNDIIIESSNQSVLSVPDTIYPNGPLNELEITGTGITQVSIYPKYNRSLKKTYMIRVGDKGSVDIQKADVTLEKDTYVFDGTQKMPKLTVSYKETPLTEGCDYTISYENNVAAGTASILLHGTRLFTGTKKITFTIQKKQTTAHTHQPVIDDAIPATCNAAGMTEGSHCSLCGETLLASTETDALTHSYVNGICEKCGDIAYIDKDSLRFPITKTLDGTDSVSVCAIPGTALTGTIEIPETISIGGTEYPVSEIAANGFADQTSLTHLIVPDTVEFIHSGAFKNCTNLSVISFYPTTAPFLGEDVWQNINSALTLEAPTYATGYYELATQSGGTLSYQNLHKHKLVYYAAVAPTCEDSGNSEYYYCSKCGRYYRDANATMEIGEGQSYLMPLGHDWESDYTIDIPATAAKDGERSIHCKRCNARKMIHSYSLAEETTEDDFLFDGSDSQSDTTSSTSSSTSSTTTTKKTYPKVGKTFYFGNLKYKITSSKPSKKQFTVTCIGARSKKIRSLIISNIVIYKGNVYKVTGIEKKAFANYKKLKSISLSENIKAIGSRAFYKCSSLRSIAIYTTKLTKKNVGKQAFKGTSKKAYIYVPAKKRKAYKKWFRTKGLSL